MNCTVSGHGTGHSPAISDAADQPIHAGSALHRDERHLEQDRFRYAKAFFGSPRDSDHSRGPCQNDLLVTIDYTSGESGPFVARESLAAIYQYSKTETMLIFPISRNRVEEITHKLDKMAKKEHAPIRYFAHHLRG
jgi:ATP-dependent Lhr-like helicase